MQKITLALMIAISLLLSLSACQPSSTPSEKPDSTAIKSTEQDTQTPVDTLEPTVVVDTAIDAQTCLSLSKAMQKINDNSQIESIDTVQELLNACLPTASNKEVLKLLENYQAMYTRFLGADLYMDDENFYTIVESLDAGKKVPVAQLEKLSLRIQYLVRLVEKKADVSILYTGEGIYVFHHNLQKMADLFSPYLPKDQQAFIQRMAQDNQEIFWNDAAIDISFEEVIARAQFWQDYIQQYPKSYFTKDAHFLSTFYRHAVFFGSNNTQWTNDAVTEFISPEYENAIRKLAKHPNSILARDARTLLEFMALPDSKRLQKYPVPEIDDDGYEIQDWSKVRYQLKAALPIPSPWEDDNNRDCLSGIVCADYKVE